MESELCPDPFTENNNYHFQAIGFSFTESFVRLMLQGTGVLRCYMHTLVVSCPKRKTDKGLACNKFLLIFWVTTVK